MAAVCRNFLLETPPLWDGNEAGIPAMGGADPPAIGEGVHAFVMSTLPEWSAGTADEWKLHIMSEGMLMTGC